MKALIVEDDQQSQQIYVRTLVKLGFDTFTASSIDEARRLLESHTFELMLCDMRVQNERGIDLLRDTHTTLEEHHTRVIVLSAEQRFEPEVTAMKYGTFVTKPIPPSTLSRIVTRLITAH